MHKLLKTSLLIAAFAPSAVLAQAVGGDHEVTIGGAGQSDNDLESNDFALTGSYGKYINDMSQVGVRQTLNITDREGSSTDFDGSTVAFYDYHFGSNKLRPFVGVNLGYNYGDRTDETFSGGPEAGVKYYVLDKTFVQGMMQYQFLFDSSNDVEDNYDDGIIYYSVGMGFNF